MDWFLYDSDHRHERVKLHDLHLLHLLYRYLDNMFAQIKIQKGLLHVFTT